MKTLYNVKSAMGFVYFSSHRPVVRRRSCPGQ